MRILSFRPALLPTLFTVPALLMLLGLGTWQVQRHFEKRAYIGRMQAQLAAPPVPLPAGALDPAAWDYRRVSVGGAFLHEREILLMAPSMRGNAGYQVITPLRRGDGGHVLVNRGWVPLDRKDAATRRQGQTGGEVAITGIARQSWGGGWFRPENDPARNLWFSADLAAMTRAAGIEAPALMVEADAAVANAGGYPLGGQTRLDIPDNHVQYALTWYGFALALGVIYVLWHRREGQKAAS